MNFIQKLFDYGENVEMHKLQLTRGEFLKQCTLWMEGSILAGSLSSENSQLKMANRVVIPHHPKATVGKRTVNLPIVQHMLNKALLELTGKSDIKTAWRSLLPGLRLHHHVAIKVNAIPAGNKILPTHPEVVQAIVSSLTCVGLPENQIIIYDRKSGHLEGAGYRINSGTTGVRCFGTTEANWGYEPDQSVEILEGHYMLSRILIRCDHLINVPVLKVHLDRYGVSLSLKNHYGSIDKPQKLHNNFPIACATLNAQKAIREKTRLVVIDSLFGCWGSKPMGWIVDCIPNRLIVTRDPVAADTVGLKMINNERAKHGQLPRFVPLLREAARLGLGVTDSSRIDLRKIEV